jgi:hypothetical protein
MLKAIDFFTRVRMTDIEQEALDDAPHGETAHA